MRRRTSLGVRSACIVYAGLSFLAHAGNARAQAEPDTSASALAAPARQHVYNSWFGSTGGVRVIDASSGEVGTLRLQLALDFFRASDFLAPGDTNQALSGALSVSATVLEQLELFAAYGTRSSSNDKGDPTLLQASGDLSLGAKTFIRLAPWLNLGADLRVLFLNSIGDVGLTAGATSVGLRAAMTADLQRLERPWPLILRANIGYLFNNSSQLISDEEQQRYDALPVASRRSQPNEDRQLVTRIERFGLGVDRLDTLGIGLGAEVPLRVHADFFIHPLLEWQIGIPINRQGYNCLSVATNASIDGSDGCFADTGIAAIPSTLTVGARVLPPVPGLSLLLAVDIGLLGTSTFVRELAPTRPWAVLLALAYGIDTRPRPLQQAQVKPYAAPVETAAASAVAAPQRVRFHGVVVERVSGTPVIGAVVRYPQPELSPQLTGAEGSFLSYELEFPANLSAAEITIEITHPDYEPGQCLVKLLPAAEGGDAPRRCELGARPKVSTLVGSVHDEHDKPLAGISVALSGPQELTLVSSETGVLSATGLAPGAYVARVDDKNHLLKTQVFSVEMGKEAALQLSLIDKPKVTHVVLAAHEIQISVQVAFQPNSAEIDMRSTGLLSELSDVMSRHPELERVQVQGHTDNRGNSAQNLALSQQRAESVVAWLVAAGIDAARLEAKGFGDERPLVPNLTPDNRARNRRVQFVILEK